MTHSSQMRRNVLACAAAMLATGLCAPLAVAATTIFPAYTSFLLSVSYRCSPTAVGARQLLDAAISGDTIKYVVSDVTTGVAGCNRNGFIYFATPALPPGAYTIQVRSASGDAVTGNRDESVTVGAAPQIGRAHV